MSGEKQPAKPTASNFRIRSAIDISVTGVMGTKVTRR